MPRRQIVDPVGAYRTNRSCFSIEVITYSFEKGLFLELKKVSVNWPKSIADKWMGCAKTQRECKGF